MRLLFVLLAAFTACSCFAQSSVNPSCAPMPFIRGLRVYGGNDQSNIPVVITGGGAKGIDTAAYARITIRFDVNEKVPPRLCIRFHHCSKEWKVDADAFVRDDFFTWTRTLSYEQAPAGVHGYTWRFTNSFPSKEHPFIRFLYSGNWIFDITDERDENTVYASGRFIVVENLVPVRLTVQNDYWTASEPPLDQVVRLQAGLHIPEQLFADYVKAVDFYRDLQIYRPARVDAYDFQVNTRVEGLGMREKTFTYMNALPGNGYRFLDLTSTGSYPNGQPVRRLQGADFTRYRFGTEASHFFGGAQTLATSADAEYLCVRFELAHPAVQGADVFVAGVFNQWDPQEEDRMHRDPVSGNYVLDRWLQRGAYDYQYVTGTYDAAAGFVPDADWTRIEGNAWEARSRRWVVVYYDDDQFGGVTRAVGLGVDPR